MMKVVKFVVRLFFLATVTAAFFSAPCCWLSVKVQGLLWGVLATLVLGRFFCEAVCPLGIVQSFVNWLFHPQRHVRRVCMRLPETNAQRIVRWSVVAVCVALGAAGCMGAATMAIPISIFGKAVTLWWPGVAAFAAVVALAAFGDGRIWCNWTCPFGTIYNLVAKLSIFKDKPGAGCGNCRKCFGNEAAHQDAGKAAEAKPSAPAATRRETLKGVAVLAVAEKLTDSGFADVSLPGVPERGVEVLPPGAGNRRTFALKCIGCQLCVANCPERCLRPSTRFGTFGQPVMDFRHGSCLLGCVKCGTVCPEGALGALTAERRPNVHMGQAVWRKDLCVRTTEGDPCTACVRKCPVQAIHLVQGFPVVDSDACVGCGACEHVCPARPLPAIFVKGYEVQRMVSSVSQSDLLAEMRSRIAAGASVAVARDGVIVAVEEGRGLAPLMKLFEADKLRGAIVVDKVIGRAAAAICAQGGARSVHAFLAGKGASDVLMRSGVPLKADKTVEVILNHEQTGSCPMEKVVAGLENSEKMVEAIRKAMKK